MKSLNRFDLLKLIKSLIFGQYLINGVLTNKKLKNL
jgi:hypothetical protein